MSPPLILTEAQTEEFVAGLKQAVAAVTDEVVKACEHAG